MVCYRLDIDTDRSRLALPVDRCSQYAVDGYAHDGGHAGNDRDKLSPLVTNSSRRHFCHVVNYDDWHDDALRRPDGFTLRPGQPAAISQPPAFSTRIVVYDRLLDHLDPV